VLSAFSLATVLSAFSLAARYASVNCMGFWDGHVKLGVGAAKHVAAAVAAVEHVTLPANGTLKIALPLMSAPVPCTQTR
jgi:hypothetical protein